jgi:tetratricopeptide (TPR) repeat protein
MADEIDDSEQDIDPEVLAEIRHAAYDLRETDPQEAVRVLRRVAKQGGLAAALANGALGEIYLNELGDLDAAEASFRAVLSLEPKLPAAYIGLGRVLREAGRLREADDALTRALIGLGHDAVAMKASSEAGEPIEGDDATILEMLEVSVEVCEIKHDLGSNGETRSPIDESLLKWAASSRIFDNEEDPDDDDDWTQFHALWARLRALTGRANEAVTVLAEAETNEELVPMSAARLRSEALELAGDKAGSLEQARRLRELVKEADEFFRPDDVEHLAGLLQEAGNEPEARAVLQEALTQAEAELKDTELIEEVREAFEEAVKTYRTALGPDATVQLGRR